MPTKGCLAKRRLLISKDIDKLEKTKFNVKHFAKRYEAYQPFALAALLVLLVEILLRITWFRRIP